MKTLSEIIAWLKQPDHVRIILVEVSDVKIQGVSNTLYLSNKPFTTSSSDTPSNTYYTACINGGINFSESLDLNGQASIGYGDIEIDNTNGDRDSWIGYTWANRDISIYIGDPRWVRSDFYQIFSGVVADISARSNNTLNLIILDKLERLNKPIYEAVLGGTGNNADKLKPLLFGECFNIEPMNTDLVPNTLEYMVHDGAIENIIEVRDNGVPVSFTQNTSTGRFNLTRSPVGQITASVQGFKPVTYSDNIATLIQSIVTTYGPSNSRFTTADINTTNFSSFASANTQAVGIYCKDRENILDICQSLASSIGASLSMDSLGKLNLVKLDLPGTGTAYSINSDDIEYNEIAISDKPMVKGSVSLAYCKNWTVQNGNLAYGIPTNHEPTFTDEWYYINVKDSGVITEYKTYEQPQQEDTYLIDGTEATAEANRRLTMWKTPRFILTVTCYAHMLPVELGDTINITHNRFGLSTGKDSLVVSIERDWLGGRVTLGLLI